MDFSLWYLYPQQNSAQFWKLLRLYGVTLLQNKEFSSKASLMDLVPAENTEEILKVFYSMTEFFETNFCLLISHFR